MSGIHFYVTGSARESWNEAARQVLKNYCGIENPTQTQVQTSAAALRQANEEHLNNDVWGVLSYDSSTPEGVDHRAYLFLEVLPWVEFDTEIFIPTPTPTEICPVENVPPVQTTPSPQSTPPQQSIPAPQVSSPPQQTPPPSVPSSERPEPPTPDAEAQTPPVQTADAATQEQNELLNAQESLRSEINRASRVIRRLVDSGLEDRANSLRGKKSKASEILNNTASSVEQIQAARDEIKRAINTICNQANSYLRSIGGQEISCQ